MESAEKCLMCNPSPVSLDCIGYCDDCGMRVESISRLHSCKGRDQCGACYRRALASKEPPQESRSKP